MIEKIITKKIISYEEFLNIFKNKGKNELITIVTKNYSNEELYNLRTWFYQAKTELIPSILEYSKTEIEQITAYRLNNCLKLKKYDIVKFYGINDFIEYGIVKSANNIEEVYEIQTLDEKSIIYFGKFKILEILGTKKSFSFSNRKFHSYKIGQKFKLHFTKEFVQNYVDFYHNNFGKGIETQLKEFKELYNVSIENIYDLEIIGYGGRYSYNCILNKSSTIYPVIIHEKLIKNHVK